MLIFPAERKFMPLLQSCKMAESGSSSRTPRERAVSLLRVVQNLLEHSNEVSITGASTEPNQGSSLQQGVENASNCGSARQNNDSARQNNDSNIMQNFRSLFAGYSASSRNQRPTRPPSAKRQKSMSGFYVPKETWTHEFFCLADRAAESVPSRSEKLELQLAGLGRKKIVFGSRDNAVKVKEKLEQVYPKLQKGGGFEILRSGVSTSVRGLCLLKPSAATGYSVNFLRNESGLGQAIAYVRPLQKSLDTLPIDVEEESGVDDCHHVGDNVPRVECVKCKVLLPVTAIKQHMLVCPAQDLDDITLEKVISTSNQQENLVEQCYLPSVASTSRQDELPTDNNQNSLQEPDAVAELNALFPDKSIDTIREILADSGGDKTVAASRLIEWSAGTGSLITSGDSGNDYCEEDADLMHSPLDAQVPSHEGNADPVAQYRQETLNENGPPLRIYVNRMKEEFTADVLAIYKKANPCFRSSLRVKFENERAVGEGPVREFFSILMGFVQNGLYLDDPGQLTMFFEGQTDHKIPVPNALMCNSGLYTSVGRMMAHSFLHGGPPVYGLSPAVVEFWTHESISETVTIEDIPDFDLRQALNELSSLDKDEEPSDALKQFLLPYRDEAAVLQVSLSGEKRHLAVQQIMLHNVIEKRRRELTDLAAGMNELCLVNYLKVHEEMTTAVFPRECEKVIDKEELKDMISIENDNHPQGQVIMGFVHKFIDEVSREAEAGAGLRDLMSFWTGWEVLPPHGQRLWIQLDDTQEATSLAESKACFHRLILQSSHVDYVSFKSNLTKALKYGARGYSSL